jgi:hypothetical protein
LTDIASALEAQGARYERRFNAVLKGSDCLPHELSAFLLAKGFRTRPQTQGGERIAMRFSYPAHGYNPIYWLLDRRYEAVLIFSLDGQFQESYWGVPK